MHRCDNSSLVPQCLSRTSSVPKQVCLNHNLETLKNQKVILAGVNHFCLISSFHRVGFQNSCCCSQCRRRRREVHGVLNTCCRASTSCPHLPGQLAPRVRTETQPAVTGYLCSFESERNLVYWGKTPQDFKHNCHADRWDIAGQILTVVILELWHILFLFSGFFIFSIIQQMSVSFINQKRLFEHFFLLYPIILYIKGP